MNRRIMLWGIIGILFITAAFITFQAGSAGGVETVQATAAVVKSTAPVSSGMVGGC
jgi:multidrug efflux pump subunit AcrA (membrane-fusion protein)